MSILIDQNTQFIIQGITGKEGRRAAGFMLDAGSNVIAGVRPGKAGETVEGVVVFDSVSEAIQHSTFDILEEAERSRSQHSCSVITVPPQHVKDAVIEAIDAGIKLVIPIAEGVPVHDAAWLYAYCQEKGARMIGPNTAGIISPGKAMAGLLGGRGKDSFMAGPVGIISRSGGMTSETARILSQAGIGQSTCVSIGGDKIVGIDIVDCLKLFAEDDETKAIVIFGEVGGTYEEQAAEYIKSSNFSKPIVAFIAGKYAEKWKNIPLGHAGAIIEGNRGTRRSKVEALESAGVTIVDVHHDIVDAIKIIL